MKLKVSALNIIGSLLIIFGFLRIIQGGFEGWIMLGLGASLIVAELFRLPEQIPRLFLNCKEHIQQTYRNWSDSKDIAKEVMEQPKPQPPPRYPPEKGVAGIKMADNGDPNESYYRKKSISKELAASGKIAIVLGLLIIGLTCAGFFTATETDNLPFSYTGFIVSLIVSFALIIIGIILLVVRYIYEKRIKDANGRNGITTVSSPNQQIRTKPAARGTTSSGVTGVVLGAIALASWIILYIFEMAYETFPPTENMGWGLLHLYAFFILGILSLAAIILGVIHNGRSTRKILGTASWYLGASALAFPFLFAVTYWITQRIGGGDALQLILVLIVIGGIGVLGYLRAFRIQKKFRKKSDVEGEQVNDEQ